MNLIKNVTMDITKKLYQTIDAKQNDVGRYIQFTLTNNSVALDLTGHTVKIFGLKTDNTLIFNNVTVVSATTGTVKAELTNQALAVAGLLNCELVIYSTDNTKISTMPFGINVIASVNNESAIESSNEFSALTSALNAINDAVASVPTVETLNTNLQSNITTGSTLHTNLQSDITTGNTTHTNLQADIAQAQQNSFATEITTARKGEVSLGAKMDKLDVQLADIVQQDLPLKADKTYVDTKTASLASGSPKGIFATLAALQGDATANTADGKKNIYLVTADGKWYYWNGSAWTVGGTYQGTGIASSSIVKDYLNSKIQDILIDNYQTIVPAWHDGGYYFYSTKQIVVDANSSYSDPISVAPGETYKINGSYYFSAKLYIILDAGGNVLNYYNTSDGSKGKVNDILVTIPQNGASLILYKYIGSDSTVQNTSKLLKVYKYTVNGANIAKRTIDKPQLVLNVISKKFLDDILASIYFNNYTEQILTWNAGGFYSRINSSIVASGSFSYANSIDVEEADEFMISGTSAWDANLYIITDINNAILSVYPNNGNGATYYSNVKFKIPSGGVHLLINKYSTETKLYKATSVSLANNLTGKKINFNGDSICAGAGYVNGYSKIIADNNGCTYENRAMGGATLSSLATAPRKVCEDVVNMASDADIVVFEGGINDYWGNVALGALTSGYTDTIDTTTFAGALESIFRQAINKWYGKPICFVITHPIQNTATTPNSIGKTYKDYYNMIVSACEKYSIPYADLFKSGGLNTAITVLYNNFTLSNTTGTGVADGTHPNEAGYRAYYVPQITALLKRLV